MRKSKLLSVLYPLPLSYLWHIRRALGDVGSILDIGCGNGLCMALLRTEGTFYTVGVDIFKPWLKECKARGSHNELVLADARYLPFRTKSVDKIIALEVLEHVGKEDGYVLIAELERVTRNKVIMTTPQGVWRQKQDEKMWGGNPYQKHLAIWTATELNSLGYKVRGYELYRICDEESLLAKVPKVRRFICCLGGLSTFFFPVLAGQLLCVKIPGERI